MKKIIYMTALLLASVSCSDWLEGVSSTQFQEKDMFTSREGFQDALTGVYLTMGSESGYGTNSTFTYMDYMVYPYNTLSSTPGYFQSHIYSNNSTDSVIESIWTSYYNTLANINIILSHLDGSQSLFSCKEEYNLYMGELLGLRAYIHLDLMRIFGNSSWTGDNAEKRTVPFQRSFSKDAPLQVTYAQAYKLLLEDVDAAIKYLEDDPVRGNMSESFENTANFEGYWNYRYLHLNYFAALALKARICMCAGDYDMAEQCAAQVVGQSFDCGAVSWVNCEDLLSPGLLASKDWSFSSEHLFSLEINGLYSSANVLFGIGSTKNETVVTIPEKIVKNVLFQDVNQYGLYSGAEDVRGTAFQLRFYSNSYVSYKLYSESSSLSRFRNKMPMIKISEMYYILAECAVRRGDNESALRYLDIVRKARNIQDDLPSEADALKELNLEYFREFVNEGQLLFWLKRHGVDDYIGSEYVHLEMDDLVLPYPSVETSYGRVQDK